ncbi:putative family 17 glucosidase SCW4 [Pseudocercospora fuligena]|uniref:Putative family 17 glucosidase SCW4 n=1 Tax=Pseudocercospora fuligena TaxID=685502 RepID=A0A8H6VPX4_9PEZI|nr:putative family 17 glucosidase SCW4 [Pseudocercospora fuligena]
MKAGLLSVVALAAITQAQVHRGHRHLHKRDEVKTEVEYVTAHAPNAVVYVDQNGKVIKTVYSGDGGPTPYSAPPAPAPAPEKAPAAPAPAPAPEAPKQAESPKPAQKNAAPNTYAPAASAPASGHGVSYSPYKVGGCKSQDEVNADFAKLQDFSMVRIYGTDCDQVNTVVTAAKAKNMKVFAGIYDITQAEAEAQKIIAAAKNDWSVIDTVSVGNEVVNAGTHSPAEVVAAINVAKGCLKGAGYTGNVVTVDTFVAMIAHPELCQASDYAAANCHAFFDGGKTADQAGDFVYDQAQRVKQACGGKKTVITESGWPHSGATNGAAVPSPENQKTAIASLKSKFTNDLILFTAFDDTWKTNNANTYGAEQYWGFL